MSSDEEMELTDSWTEVPEPQPKKRKPKMTAKERNARRKVRYNSADYAQKREANNQARKAKYKQRSKDDKLADSKRRHDEFRAGKTCAARTGRHYEPWQRGPGNNSNIRCKMLPTDETSAEEKARCVEFANKKKKWLKGCKFSDRHAAVRRTLWQRGPPRTWTDRIALYQKRSKELKDKLKNPQKGKLSKKAVYNITKQNHHITHKLAALDDLSKGLSSLPGYKEEKVDMDTHPYADLSRALTVHAHRMWALFREEAALEKKLNRVKDTANILSMRETKYEDKATEKNEELQTLNAKQTLTKADKTKKTQLQARIRALEEKSKDAKKKQKRVSKVQDGLEEQLKNVIKAKEEASAGASTAAPRRSTPVRRRSTQTRSMGAPRKQSAAVARTPQTRSVAAAKKRSTQKPQKRSATAVDLFESPATQRATRSTAAAMKPRTRSAAAATKPKPQKRSATAVDLFESPTTRRATRSMAAAMKPRTRSAAAAKKR